MPEPKFQIGDAVFKWTGDYTGPGIVRGISILGNGKVRYLVGHTIERGTGEFLHVYAEGNLRPIDEAAVLAMHAAGRTKAGNDISGL